MSGLILPGIGCALAKDLPMAPHPSKSSNSKTLGPKQNIKFVN
jgi:hypothetical protein